MGARVSGNTNRSGLGSSTGMGRSGSGSAGMGNQYQRSEQLIYCDICRISCAGAQVTQYEECSFAKELTITTE